MKSLVDIAIESNAEIGTWDKSGNGQKLISFTHAELKAFAEACLNEWLKEQKVVGGRQTTVESNSMRGTETIRYSYYELQIMNDDVPLIKLPSEEK